MTTKPKGRKEKPAEEKRSHCISVWLTAEDKALIEQAAKKSRLAAGAWLGNHGVDEARKALKTLEKLGES